MSGAGDGRRFLLGFTVAVLGGLVLLAVWFGITGAMLWSNASGLQASASTLRLAATDGDLKSAVAAVRDATDQAAAASSTLASPPWSWAQDFPVVGGTVSAGATFAAAADSVLSSASGLADGLAQVGSADSVASAAGGLTTVAPQLQAAAGALASAAHDVAAIEPQAVLPFARDRVAYERDRFLGMVTPASDGAATAAVLPDLLGAAGTRDWLVVLSQPSEARGSGGGFFGAFTTVTASDGSFAMAAPKANDRIASVKQDVSWLPEEYQQLWGTDAEYLWGFNLTRHYPYSAQVAYEATKSDADYVVSLDPRMVAAFMRLTGPVTVEGITLDASNAEQFFARDIYVQFENPAEKDRITFAFLHEVFKRLSRQPPSPAAVWAALGPVVTGQHLQVWAADPAVQERVLRSPLGGAVPATDSPWVTAAFNNTAGNKIDSYVDTAVEYRVTGSCDAEWVRGQITATLTLEPIPTGLPGYISGRNDEPHAPYGTSSMYVHLYGPMGSLGRDMQIDGASVPVIQGAELGHKVWGTKVQLQPGVPVQFTATFDQKPYPGQPLQVQPQPMVKDTAVTIVDERSCGS